MGRRYSTLDSSANGWMYGQLLGIGLRLALTFPGAAALTSITIGMLITGGFKTLQMMTWTSPNLLFLKNKSIPIERRCNIENFPTKGNESERAARDYLCLPSYRYKAMADKFEIEQSDDWGKEDRKRIDSYVQAFSDVMAEEKIIKQFEKENPNHPAIMASNKRVSKTPIFYAPGRFETAPNTPYNFECEVRQIIRRDNHCGPYLKSTPTYHLKAHK